ncbi:uncharacterized protein LAESUDRAFT_761186 [Laetiporus sulphureus 93-53]|uniref:Uncharacterized protein n=1 Tax=Laetiporus sulphureus 93-53 TaxID=1314785 RepID=A0A165D8L1_9APHY|nr:uncharacterized protein LAESUDRAFT_761186 [Laetiporus sulphureus 93-53]KZT04335.1 hypothetical protein LAESUDRAFT_761186 [Laetiporus sulphureus 93-53]
MDTPSKDLDLDNTTAIEHNKYLSHDKQPVGPPRLRFTTVYDYSKTAYENEQSNTTRDGQQTLHDEADPGVIDRPLLRRESPELQVGLRDLLMERERHINAKIRKRLLRGKKKVDNGHRSEAATSSGQETELLASSETQTVPCARANGQALDDAAEVETVPRGSLDG